VGVAALFLVLACFFYLGYFVDRAAAQYWTRSGHLAAWRADLATPATYSVSFQIEPNLSDPILELEIPRAVAARKSPKELLSGLHATLDFVDPAGEVVFLGGFGEDDRWSDRPGSASIRLSEFGYYNLTGRCRVDVTVKQGAPALKGIPHQFVLLGHMASFSTGMGTRASAFMGHATLSAAALILLAVALSSLYKRWRPVDHQQSETPAAT
jgi:hypothetical protein